MKNPGQPDLACPEVDKINKELTKLVLGTVQLGLDYGIANQDGKPGEEESLELLEKAWAGGITAFDTAPAYGSSESLLGKFIASEKGRSECVTIITKALVPAGAANQKLSPTELMKEQLLQSLENLGVNKIDYYLLHNPANMEDPDLMDTLFLLKDQGLIAEPGVSVYSVAEAREAVKRGLRVLQAPVNIFDRRFIDPPLLHWFKEQGATLMARSVFLQGLFFIDPEQLPPGVEKAEPYLKQLRQICQQENITVQEMALKFVDRIDAVDHIIIGTDNQAQLTANLQALKGPALPESLMVLLEKTFGSVPDRLTDPRKWER